MLATRMNPELKGVVQLLATAAREVHAGEISPSQGSALAAIGSTLVKAVESAELSLRLSILEVRLGQSRDDFDDF